jgi:hypothetical protein
MNGVYGFSQGEARFWLNEDAEFFVGNGNSKNIRLDADGNFSIAATNFKLETAQGLILDSNASRFKIGDDTAYIDYNNGNFSIAANVFNLKTVSEDLILDSNASRFKIGDDIAYLDYVNNTLTVKGTIYADSGEFKGTVYADSGEFNGTVYADSGEFNGIVKSAKGEIGNWIIDNGLKSEIKIIKKAEDYNDEDSEIIS